MSPTLTDFARVYFVLLTISSFLLCGFSIAALGIYLTEIYAHEPYVTETLFVYAPNVLIILGLFLFLIGYTGGCGLVKENFYMSAIFTAFLVLIFLLEVIFIVSAFILPKEIEHLFWHWLPSLWKYRISADTHFVWDTLQKTLHCCGLRNSTDWIRAGVLTIPNSCYNHADTDNASKLYKIGYIESLDISVRDYLYYIVVAVVILMIIQVSGIRSFVGLTRKCHKCDKMVAIK
ncbi:Tetraspanin family [Popillia japonica]|uniref:Tetraspanin n=1 Tax=Popillia japonica TaxID=7064 RepID=A0AAW1JVL3_POPJA